MIENGAAKQSSTERVRQALRDAGHPQHVVAFDASTRTAKEAAAVIGCSVAQIAKSLLFRAKQSDRAVLVVAAGDNRVDEKKIADALGEEITRADAAFVRENTGFAIGGVAPVGHVSDIITFVDASLSRHAHVWAAAGTPRQVFATTPEHLATMTKGTVIDVAKD